jgi:hypothetical protein
LEIVPEDTAALPEHKHQYSSLLFGWAMQEPQKPEKPRDGDRMVAISSKDSVTFDAPLCSGKSQQSVPEYFVQMILLHPFTNFRTVSESECGIIPVWYNTVCIIPVYNT